MLVFNLIDYDKYVVFSDDITEKYALAYCYCVEHDMLDGLFQANADNKLDNFYCDLPFTRDKHSIICGNWCVKLGVK